MKTIFGKQKYFVPILMTHIASFDAAPDAGGICQVGDVIAPGESCTYPDTDKKFSVNANGTGQFLFLSVGSNLNLEDATINGVSYTFVAKKLANGSWEIEKIGTAPATTNTAPVFTDGISTTRSVAENTAASTNIGTAIAATDADSGDTLTYTLSGTDAASFSIVSTSGQLQTKAALDYETKSSYTVTITVSDGNGGSDSITVTINVTDVNETIIISPRFVPLADRTPEIRDAIVAAVPNVTDAAKVTKAQVAAITNLTLRNAGITELKAGDFSGMTGLTSINLYNNQLSSLPNGIFEGLTSLTTVRLGRNAVDPLPFDVSLEKVGNGEFKAVAPAGALFNIVLHITVTNGSITGGVTTVTIPKGNKVSDTLTVTRTAGTTADVTVDIETFPNLPRNHYGYALVKSGNLPLVLFRGTNTAPVFTDGANTTRSIAENTTAGTNIGSPISATDADNDTLAWTLGGTNASSFSIVSTSGQLQTKAALDYEAKTSYSVTVSVSDSNGGSDSITVTINITDVNETPTNTAPVFTEGNSATRTVAENTTAGTHIGNAITATDSDNDTLTYRLGGQDASAFDINSRTGQLQTKAALDYETKTSYSVTVSVSDGNGGTDSITVTINVTDVNETTTNIAPVFTEGSTATRSVTENIEARQHIGPAVAATDADGDTLAYTLGGTDAASFGIDATTGQLKTKSPLDYETKRAYTVTITVSDGTLTDTITVTINVTDIDESLGRPNESSYDHIEGPWLWMIAPGGSIITDNLSKASDGVITEAQIAQNGVNEGDHFNDLQWTSGRLLPTTVCGIFLCSSDNVINVVRKIGLTDRIQLNQYSAYALINIYSPRDQNNVLMGVGSDDSIKVWLNGSVVYINNTTRRTTGIQNRFHVNLNAGNNLLLVKVCNSGSWVGNDDWGMFFKIYLDMQGYTLSLPMGDGNSWQPVTPAEDTPAPTTNTRIAFEANTPTGYTPVTLSDNGTVWGVPTQYTTDSDIGTVAYMALAELMGCSFADAEIARQSKVYIKRQSLGTLNNFASGTVCGMTSRTWSNNWTGARITHLRFFDEASLPNIKEAIYNAATDQIEIPDVSQQPPNGTSNAAPTFTEGSSTTRSVAENTVSGLGIGTAVAATDANGDTLTYTLGGTDAASFSIDRTTGQLQTKTALDYETKRAYTVTVTVSDGTLTDTITVTINVTDIDETVPNRAPVFTEGSTATRSVAENMPPGRHIGTAVAATDVDGNTLAYTLGGTDAASFDIDSTTGQLKTKAALDYETKRAYTVTVTASDGTLTDTITVTINVTDVDERQQQITTVCQVGDILNPGESCTYPNTDAVFSVLDNGKSRWNIPDLPSLLQWINQVSIDESMRVSTTVDGVSYHFVAEQTNGNSWEIKEIGDQGVQEPETPQQPEQPQQPGNTGGTPTLSLSTASPLTEATLHGGVVSLNLSGGTFESVYWDLDDEISVSGITGVTYDDFYDVERISDTKVNIELSFDGNMASNGTLTFTVESGAIVDYDGTDLTAQISVSAVSESITATTTTALTEGNIDGSEVTITLSGRKFEGSIFDIRDAFSVSGITGVTIPWYYPDRESDTELTLELEFDGDMTTDGTLTFTVGADAIAGYNGPDLTAQISVSSVTESITASPATITEAALDGTEVTLTLSGRKFERSVFGIRDAVSVSGITGVTFPWHDPDKDSDTVLTLELEFAGDMTVGGTLTFTVGADAIAGYNGPALTAQVTVTAGAGIGLGANFPNPFNPETWIPYQLAKEAKVTLTIYNMQGVVVRQLKLGHKPPGVYTTRSRAIYWDGKNETGESVASGVYFYTLTAGDFSATRKMLIRK